MGYKLVAAVLPWAPYLGKHHRAMLVLFHMAYTARDEPNADTPAAHFWGGHRALAIPLGYINPERGEVQPSRSQMTEIGAVIKQLREVGAIELVKPAAHGRAALYRIIPRGGRPPPKYLPR